MQNLGVHKRPVLTQPPFCSLLYVSAFIHRISIVWELELFNGSREYGPKGSHPEVRSPETVLWQLEDVSYNLHCFAVSLFSFLTLHKPDSHHGAAFPSCVGDNKMTTFPERSSLHIQGREVYSVLKHECVWEEPLLLSFYIPSVAFISQRTLTPLNLKPKERLFFPAKRTQRFLWDLENLGIFEETQLERVYSKNRERTQCKVRMCRICPKEHGKGSAMTDERWGGISCLIWIERCWHKPAY